ncbi:hypothetical protein I316_03189 [Kwoniella heveanensis BCC8398]|uniref:Uncharacterized protein n=1 Tax=Kwoniella heveanensis BCC8398 TaxID=1296120 RepID=A0A1B9GVS5_9TREE|nr:hypothetical protein I316_03189 [Kwoniella heveanensis BCC8398]
MAPHTYPVGQASRSSRLPKGRQPPQPLFLGSGQSSMYLSPVQEARIKSWAEGASTAATPPPSTATTAAAKKKVSKSAPASDPDRDHDRDRHLKGGPNANVKGYYSSSRKQTGSNMTKTLPEMMTVRPKTPPRALRNPASALRMATFQKPDPDQTGTSSPVSPGHGQQARAYEAGSPPPIQWAPAPGQDVPVRQMTVPRAPQAPNMPRIAGVRDPISTNYYRNMFPPQGMYFTPGVPVVAPEIGVVPNGRWDLASKAPNSAMRG